MVSIFTLFCSPSPEFSCLLHLELWPPLCNNSPFSDPPQALVTIILLSVFLHLTTSCKWNYTICVFLWVTYFTECPGLKFHPCWSMCIFSFFLMLITISQYVCISYLFIYPLMGIGLLPPLAYCEYCCYEHRGASTSWDPAFNFFGIFSYAFIEKWDCWINW